MTKYIISIAILLSGYYSFSYGIFQWKNEKNKLGAFGTFMLSIIGTVVPVIFLIIRT